MKLFLLINKMAFAGFATVLLLFILGFSAGIVFAIFLKIVIHGSKKPLFLTKFNLFYLLNFFFLKFICFIFLLIGWIKFVFLNKAKILNKIIRNKKY